MEMDRFPQTWAGQALRSRLSSPIEYVGLGVVLVVAIMRKSVCIVTFSFTVSRSLQSRSTQLSIRCTLLSKYLIKPNSYDIGR